MVLEAPTLEIVANAAIAFDEENEFAEDALRLLFKDYPHNTDPSHVLLKATTLDRLYSTKVPDIQALAKHILTCRDLDSLVDKGDALAVERITVGEGLRKNYSFATKYCSWHKPEGYPIFDSNVDECLWAYMQQDGFCSYRDGDLRDYKKFLQVLEAFRQCYDLKKCSHKELDKFLYLKGREIRAAREAKAAKA